MILPKRGNWLIKFVIFLYFTLNFSPFFINVAAHILDKYDLKDLIVAKKHTFWYLRNIACFRLYVGDLIMESSVAFVINLLLECKVLNCLFRRYGLFICCSDRFQPLIYHYII